MILKPRDSWCSEFFNMPDNWPDTRSPVHNPKNLKDGVIGRSWSRHAGFFIGMKVDESTYSI